MSIKSDFANLYPANYKTNPRAAHIVSDLIYKNYLPDPLPDGLPKPWKVAIQAISRVRHMDQNTRWRAFMDATKQYPYAMIDEVNIASCDPTTDRSEKDRILYRLKDVIQPPPPREWVVDGILSRSSLNLLVGNPGSKKTYMAVDLALCVAMGKPWLGCPIGTRGIPSPAAIEGGETPSLPTIGNQGDDSLQSEPLQRRENRKPDQEDSTDASLMRRGSGGNAMPPAGVWGSETPKDKNIDHPLSNSSSKISQPVERSEGFSVLFVDEETGFQQLWPRLHAAILGHQTDESPRFCFTTLAGYDFRSEEDAKMLRDRALDLNVGLIVIDALADLMATAENSVASVQTVLFNLRRLADFTRAAVLVIHHTNRRGYFRGSSAIAASMDLMLSIDSSPNDSYIEFRTLKARFSSPKPFAANAIFSTNAAGEPTIHLEPAELRSDPEFFPESNLASPRPGLTQSILEFLSRNPNSTRSQIATKCSDFDSGSVFNTLSTLIDSGQVIRSNAGGKGTLGHYALPTELPSDLVK